ncbi:Rad52/22 double-strand break repair protein [Umbelopsis sp. PMI_123]|nr:Rad52/22 double-strand break repair protein [Umbelopsis sp. PMI_123]
MSTDKETSGVQQFGTSCFTPDEYAYLQHVLAKQLGPEWVKQRPGPAGAGTMVYVEGHTIINLANKLFGFNGWSSEIKSMTTDYIDVLENGRMNICISVVMRVTLKDGTFHEDIGVGSMENCKSKAIGIQKAKKEAVTDATKRAIRYFGSVLGNCIHDKVYMRDIMRLPTPIVCIFNKVKICFHCQY